MSAGAGVSSSVGMMPRSGRCGSVWIRLLDPRGMLRSSAISTPSKWNVVEVGRVGVQASDLAQKLPPPIPRFLHVGLIFPGAAAVVVCFPLEPFNLASERDQVGRGLRVVQLSANP